MASPERETGARRSAPREAPRGEQRRPIVVVDDDPVIAEFCGKALRHDGFDVVTATSGREALRTVYADPRPPALLLTDVNMPAMSGIELAARLTADRPGVPVMLMTGDPASRDEALRHPDLVASILLKPFGAAELVAAVRSVLDSVAPRRP